MRSTGGVGVSPALVRMANLSHMVIMNVLYRTRKLPTN